MQVLIVTFEPVPQSLGFQPQPNSSPKNGKRKADDVDSNVGGWIYVGSHNFSSAAWVRYCFDGYSRLLTRKQGTVNFKKQPAVLNVS